MGCRAQNVAALFCRERYGLVGAALPARQLSTTDRAAVRVHDIGLYLRRSALGEVGFEVLVGGLLGLLSALLWNWIS